MEDILEKKIFKILSTGKVDSKLTLTNLLIKSGIKDYELRLNLLSNEVYAEIPKIGKTLKRLRFEKKVNFSILNGSHAYYLNKKKKMLSLKKTSSNFFPTVIRHYLTIQNSILNLHCPLNY